MVYRRTKGMAYLTLGILVLVLLSGCDLLFGTEEETEQISANGGSDQTVNLGGPVTVDGGDSSGSSLDYQWGFSAVPATSLLTNTNLQSANQPVASFTPDVVGTYRLTLTVSSGSDSDTDVVEIRVVQTADAPTADPGADRVVAVDQEVALDGSQSSDPNANPLTYLWTFVSTPTNSSLTNQDISNSTTSLARFTPDVEGTYRLLLTVNNGEFSGSATVDIEASTSDLSEYSGADASGNLVLVNRSNEQLVLYQGETPLRVIPNDSSDFLINIPNAVGGAVDLRLHRLQDVQNDIENPDASTIYKRWEVPLVNSTALADRSSWVVTADEEQSTTGTVTFDYLAAANSDVFVDVYLNSRTGARLTSLRAGDVGRSVGIGYGNYTVLYRYWRSDQNTAEGSTELGWIESLPTADGSDVPYYVVLNSSRTSMSLRIPSFNGGSQAVDYGDVLINNETNQPIEIWTNDSRQIEELVVLLDDQVADNLSTIFNGDDQSYALTAGEYSIEARDLQGAVIGEVTFTVEAGADIQIDINGENDITVTTEVDTGLTVTSDLQAAPNVALSLDSASIGYGEVTTASATVGGSDIPDGATVSWYVDGEQLDDDSSSVSLGTDLLVGQHTITVVVTQGETAGSATQSLTIQ